MFYSAKKKARLMNKMPIDSSTKVVPHRTLVMFYTGKYYRFLNFLGMKLCESVILKSLIYCAYGASFLGLQIDIL